MHVVLVLQGVVYCNYVLTVHTVIALGPGMVNYVYNRGKSHKYMLARVKGIAGPHVRRIAPVRLCDTARVHAN